MEEGPDTVAAFFAEPVMGAAGAILPPTGYFEAVQAILRKYDILFVVDEVICGFGRTGNMWGSQTFDLQPDMMTSAKALSAAMLPISALMVNERIYQAMLAESDKLGAFAHGFTYTGHPVTSAVALEVLKIYEELDIVARVRKMAPFFHDTLGRFADHPMIGDVRGLGFICGMELMRDKSSRQPFDSHVNIGAKVGAASRRHGLVHRVMGDRIAFAPSLVISEEEIDYVAERLERSLDEVWAEVG